MEGKTNEIAVFRPVLSGLDLADTVVTFDALHSRSAERHRDRVAAGRIVGRRPGADRGVESVAVDALQDPAHGGLGQGGGTGWFTGRAAEGGELRG